MTVKDFVNFWDNPSNEFMREAKDKLCKYMEDYTEGDISEAESVLFDGQRWTLGHENDPDEFYQKQRAELTRIATKYNIDVEVCEKLLADNHIDVYSPHGWLDYSRDLRELERYIRADMNS